MYHHLSVLRALISFLLPPALIHSEDLLDPVSYSPENILTREVAIVGGGSGGVYSAVRLQDYNKSVLIIEKNNYLGAMPRPTTTQTTTLLSALAY